MKNNKKPSALYAKLVSLFVSRTSRNIIFGALLCLSAFLMLLVDEGNLLRKNYFTFLENNLLLNILSALGIKPFNVTISAWIVFMSIFLVGIVFLICSIWAPVFASRMALKNGQDPSDNKIITKNKLIFYSIPLAISAVLVFLSMMIMSKAGYLHLAKADGVLFLNLLFTLLLFLLMIVLTLVAIVAVFYLAKFLFWALGMITYYVAAFYRDITASKKVADAKAQKQLEDVYKQSGSPLESVEQKKNENGGSPSTEDVSAQSQATTAETAKEASAQEKDMFYALTKIDQEYEGFVPQHKETDLSLEQLILQFQAFAIKRQIYYELPVLRSFVAGLAASRLIVLEGISGTGKSMLPRLFSEFIQCKSLFVPVQSTWRDKSNVLGFYSEFTKSFKVTDFLKRLYEASYFNEPNIMVLDEMNLSRIEYYFADFLSVLEYPKEDWLIKLIEPEIGQKLPAKLNDGYVRIPANTWFVGTANTDDSTFTITDKVYDRACVIDFRERFSPLTSDYSADPIDIDTTGLLNLFESAKTNEAYRLTDADEENFAKLCDFVRDRLDLRFGNRIMVQIRNFVPVYVAMGGDKNEALDIMFARKILRKLNGMYDDYVKDSLLEFKKLLHTLYGEGAFAETEKFIDRIVRRLV